MDAAMKTKYYVVFYDSTQLIFPVKANVNPYDPKGDWYCGGFPQFFGGTANVKWTVPENLFKEVKEESIKTYELTAKVSDLALLLSDASMYFYATEAWTAGSSTWPASESDWAGLPNPNREMCWVATMKKSAIDGLDLADKSIVANTLINAAHESVGTGWPAAQMQPKSNVQFRDSHTLAAFQSFLTAWRKKVK
jgi:hypothetical protein